MALLYVVSRDAPDTFAYLTEAFKGIAEVEILFDRRRAERRQGPPLPSDDRRQGDRRKKSIKRDLDTIGSALVKR
jgi:hypothetical protein